MSTNQNGPFDPPAVYRSAEAQQKKVTRADFDRVMVPNYAPADYIPVRGHGSRVWDQTGKEYVDFAAGIAVSCLGHTHPALVKALTDQANLIWHLSNTLTNEPALRLADKFTQATFAERVFFANSGAEANEAAFKLVRRAGIERGGPEKTEIIAFTNAFHGRTFFTVCVGGQAKYSDNFGPKPGAITHLPYNDLTALEKMISAKTCAVVVEPVQGEGGIMPATKEFLQGARALCDKHGALLVFDEIQTGMGRSGQLFAYMNYGVKPDILTSAKGIGGGFPLAAMLTTADVAKHFAFGTHGSTYGGNALATAVGNAVIDNVNKPEVLAAVRAKSERFFARLNEIKNKYKCFAEIRGMGLLIGSALTKDFAGRAKEFIKASEAQGLILLMAGPDVVRMTPSLIIPDSDIDEGLDRFEKAVASIVNKT